MLSAELKVNGVTVMEVYGHREEATESEKLEFNYRYSVWEPRYGRVINGVLPHYYADGIDTLVAKILTAVAAKRKADINDAEDE